MLSAPFSLLFYCSLFFSVMLVSGNNLSACLGTAVGARIVSQKFAVLLGASGFILGLVTIGHDMGTATASLLPSLSGVNFTTTGILLAMILVFIIGNRLRVPLSISMSLIGVLIGIVLGRHLALNSTYLTFALALWVAAPIISILVMCLFVRKFISSSEPEDLWSRLNRLKILIIIASFLTAYASGANSVALLVSIPGFSSTNVLIACFAIIFGTIFFSAGEIKRVGTEILMLRYSNTFLTLLTSAVLIIFANLVGLPLSSTQSLSASVFGTGISYKNRLISAKPFVLILVGWIVAPLLSLAIGLFLLS